MTLDEYDREINRRLWRRRAKAASIFIFNPMAVLIYAHIILDVVFALLGWEE